MSKRHRKDALGTARYLSELGIATCISAIVLSPGSAMAQSGSTPTQAPPESSTGEQALPASSPDPAEPAENQEIVVTAQKRSERLQDVPISITVQTGADLQRSGVGDTRDLATVIPSLTMQSVGATVQPSIRGVTTQLAEPGSEVNVATYIDNVYRPDPSVGVYDLPDIDRIEVLKGPQGTLFGRNATGGAIQIFTKTPKYKFSGDFVAGYGNLDNRTLRGFVTGPVIDQTLAFSVSGSYEKRDGYIDDLLLGGKAGRIDSKSVRGKLLFEPTANVRFLLSAYYNDRFDENGQTFTPLNGNTLARVLDPTAIIPDGKRETAQNERGEVTVKSKGISLRTTVDLPVATLTSITSYNRLKNHIVLDGDASSSNLAIYHVSGRNKDFTQELNLASTSTGKFSWIAGMNYFYNQNFFDPNIVNNFVYIVAGVTTKSYAGFGELTYKPVERLSITGGLRYTHERRVADAAFGSGAYPTDIPLLGKKSFNALTPRASVRYEIDPRSNVYFSYTHGFKSGVFNLFSLNPNALKPEKIKAYEVGYKTGLGRRYSLNAAAYYYRYTDQQVNALTNVNGVPLTSVQNAASANIYGVEVDGSYSFTPEFTGRAAVSYLHARYDDFPNASVQVPTGLGGNQTIVIDASGFDEIRSPALTASFTASYRRSFSAGDFDASATFFRSSRYYLDTANRVRQPAYSTLAAQANFTLPSGLRFGVWGKNLTNADVLISNLISDLGDPVQWGTKRTFGGTIGYAF